MTEEESKYNDIKKSIDDYIGVPTSEIRKKATEEDRYQADFVSLIRKFEKVIERDTKSYIELDLNLTQINAPFYEIIDTLMELSFPDDTVRNIIYFYLYDRFNEFGELVPLIVEGHEFTIQTPLQLYGVLKYLESKYN